MAELTYYRLDGTTSRHSKITIPIQELDVFQHCEQLRFNSLEETAIFAKDNYQQRINPIFLSKQYQFIYDARIYRDSLITVAWNEDSGEKIVKYSSLSGEISLDNYTIDGEIFDVWIIDEDKIIWINKDSQNILTIENFISNEKINFPGHSQAIISISLLEETNMFASVSEDKTVRIWDINERVCIKTIKLPGYCSKILLAKSNRLIGWEGKPQFWVYDFKNEKFLLSKTDINPVTVLINNIEKNLYVLVGRQDGVIDCYLLNSCELVWSNRLSDGWVYKIENSSDNSLLFVSGSDGNIYVIDALCGQLQQTLSGHSGGVWNIITTSKYILTSGLDETIRVWDIQSGDKIAILAGHNHKIRQMLMTDDKKYLISRDKLGNTIAWSADWDGVLS
mgnify:CR=1 FL=1